ncbi:MAG: hypothetical protein KDI46_07970 [Alphaproteobacteria bacterium]|nr:hypothetical protein [Alphaproteobacteria bacterium]
MDYSQWLQAQFAASPDKSKAELARALGLEPSAVSKILSGSRQIKAHEYALMRRFFGLPTDGDKAARGQSGSYIVEPFMQNKNTGMHDTGASQEAQSVWQIPAHVITQRTQAAPEQIRIFEVEDSLMEPEFRRGEPVLVDLSVQKPTPAGAFLISDGYGYMIRHCEIVSGETSRKDGSPLVHVSSLNQAFPAKTLFLGDFELVGRVIAKLQWV